MNNNYYDLQSLQEMFPEKNQENYHSEGEESITSLSSTGSKKRLRTLKSDSNRKGNFKKPKEGKGNGNLKPFLREIFIKNDNLTKQ